MFQKELLYNKKLQQTTTQKIISVENSPVDEKSINLATKTLSQALMSTLDNPLSRTDYGIIRPETQFNKQKCFHHPPHLPGFLGSCGESGDGSTQLPSTD